MKRWWFPTIVLLASLVLLLICLRRHGPGIEADVTARAREGLAAAGFDPELVTVDGRDATLAGAVASDGERDRLVDIVSSVRGVRTVVDRLTSEAPGALEPGGVPAAVPAPVLGIRSTAAGVALTGAVGSEEARDRVLAAARSVWSEAGVDDRLAIDPDAAEPAAWEGLDGLFELVANRVEGVELALGAGEATLGGRVASREAAAEIVADLSELLPGLEVVDRLEVEPPAAAPEPREAEEAALAESLARLDLARRVEFDVDSADLRPASLAALDELAELLAASPAVRIRITGHTDSQSTAAYNLDLSRRRAEAVRDYLVARGLAAGRFEARGAGESQPLADNASAAGRQRNRRVEANPIEESP